MKRISSNASNNDMQYHLRLREWQMDQQQNKMAEQTRIGELRDDPVAAAHATRYLSRIERLNRYTKNAETLQADNRIAEGYMRSAVDILHRARELAIQGATGTMTKEETRYMAAEVNQLFERDGSDLQRPKRGRTKPSSAVTAPGPGLSSAGGAHPRSRREAHHRCSLYWNHQYRTN